VNASRAVAQVMAGAGLMKRVQSGCPHWTSLAPRPVCSFDVQCSMLDVGCSMFAFSDPDPWLALTPPATSDPILRPIAAMHPLVQPEHRAVHQLRRFRRRSGRSAAPAQIRVHGEQSGDEPRPGRQGLHKRSHFRAWDARNLGGSHSANHCAIDNASCDDDSDRPRSTSRRISTRT